jgi:hypothetical protein
MTNTSKHSGDSSPRWWETPGSLRTGLLKLDGQMGMRVNAEKHVASPAVVSDNVALHLRRIAQQIGLDARNGMANYSDSEPVFEPVKPGFTREAGLFLRRQVSSHGVGDPGE